MSKDDFNPVEKLEIIKEKIIGIINYASSDTPQALAEIVDDLDIFKADLLEMLGRM